MNLLRRGFLRTTALGYSAIRPLIFANDAQTSHEKVIKLLARADASDKLCALADFTHRTGYPQNEIYTGDVTLTQRTMLAAGFVKGHGFASEEAALAAVDVGDNIIPGWRVMPRLVGLVEYGSYTRYPRVGNSGTVMWRDVATQSTQNRVGLKNPGAVAAAEFLQRHVIDLPYQFGINIAVSPGIEDTNIAVQHVREAIHAFLVRHIVPNWFTLNISCPNTEDDPEGNQTEALTKALCECVIAQINADGFATPLWVKISPDLAPQQYKILMHVFAETGVKAVIATNTIGRPTPPDKSLQAGVGGGALLPHAVDAARQLQHLKQVHDYPVDVIGCGGILTGGDYARYKVHGIEVVQYWSALVYRGVLAGALIESDLA